MSQNHDPRTSELRFAIGRQLLLSAGCLGMSKAEGRLAVMCGAWSAAESPTAVELLGRGFSGFGFIK